MSYSVGDLIEMARALSEGQFEEEFEQHFQGELGELATYLEAVRQTLQSLAVTANGSCELIPKAADGVAEINREAESRFNSVWDVIEQIQADQATVRALLGTAHDDKVALGSGEIRQLREVADKHQQGLLMLMSYLSFQDVLRQRLEKIQKIIGQVEDKTLELMVKFKVKANEQKIRDGEESQLLEPSGLDQSLVDQLMERLR